jgi:uncharacterized membrane-anchored protein YitT (DUF2179 family)
VPNDFAPGGASGIAVIISRLIPIPVGVTIFLVNLPLIIIGLIKLGKRYMLLTGYVSVIISVAVDILASLDFVHKALYISDPFLVAIVGGAFAGIGVGIILRGSGSSGCTDIIVRLLRIKFKHLKTGFFFLIIDTTIILTSAIIFGDIEKALYSAVVLIVATRTIDAVLYGNDEAKLLIIVSDRHEEIAKKLLTEVDTGATYLEGSGAYTNSQKRVVMCAIKKQNFTKARKAVREIDEDAFMIVTSASEIFGMGYKKHNVDEL